MRDIITKQELEHQEKISFVMKKNILIAASMLFFVLACQKEVIENNISGTKSIDAEVEIINETKTSFNPSESSTGPRSIIWNAGDQITIFDGIGNKCIGSLETGAGSSSATFTYEGIDTPEVALYPADGDATFDGTSISFDIPKEQEYCGPNTFGADANPAVAIVSDGKLLVMR